MIVEDCGAGVAYVPMWQRQERLVEEIIARRAAGEAYDERLLIVEHSPVYTLGRHGDAANMLLSSVELGRLGAELVQTDRGGDITFHGPGQLVAYPIIDLLRHRMGVKDYVHTLEQAVIDTIATYGINGRRVQGATGVWLDVGTPRERKICAIGVRCKRFVTCHGLALNVNTDLRYFQAINPCGFTDKGVTSLAAELGQSVDFEEVKHRFTLCFAGLLH